MVRYQKIKKLLHISLISLLFLAACSTPKQQGVALYMPERSYKRVIVDTVKAEGPVEIFELNDSVEKAVPVVNDTVIIPTSSYSAKFDKSSITIDKVHVIIDTLIVDKNRYKAVYDTVTYQKRELNNEIVEEDKSVTPVSDTIIIDAVDTVAFIQDTVIVNSINSVASIPSTVIPAAKIDSTVIIHNKLTKTIPAEKIRKANAVVNTVKELDRQKTDSLYFRENLADRPTEIIDTIVKTVTIEQTDTVFKTVEIEKQDTVYRNIEIEKTDTIFRNVEADRVVQADRNKTASTNTYRQKPTEQRYYQETQAISTTQVPAKPIYDNRQAAYENAHSANPVRSSDWQQPRATQPGRVQIQSGEHYLNSAAGSQKNYLQRPTPPAPVNTSSTAGNREIAQLQARVYELSNQNNQLRNSLYGIQSTIDRGRIAPGQPSQVSNQQKIDEISSRLEAITNYLSATTAKQTEVRDTIIQERLVQDTVLILDTIISTRPVENPELAAEVLSLQDSIAHLQHYINLKNKAFDSLEGKIIAPKSNDSIFYTAYYGPGKIISTKEKEILSEVNRKIVDRRVAKVSLISYTDRSGSPELNLRLSNQRVVRWVNELIKNGIPRELIFMQYFGAEYASKEVVDNERRVEIIVELEK